MQAFLQESLHEEVFECFILSLFTKLVILDWGKKRSIKHNPTNFTFSLLQASVGHAEHGPRLPAAG